MRLMRYFTLFPFTLQYWMSINYTYEGNMMSVHIKSSPYYRYNLSRTHFARLIWNLCTVHFHSTVLDVYYLHLWKQYDVFVHIKSSLYYRYNWSRTHFGRLIRNLYIVHFHSTVLDVYYLHLWKKEYDVFVHIKSSLYYRYNYRLSRTQLWDWWGISHCLLSHYSTGCPLLTLMKEIRYICAHKKFTVL